MNTLYETIKTYGKGKGEDMMWRSVAVISDAVEKYFTEQEKESLVSDIYGLMTGGHYDEHHAMKCVSKMYYVDKAGEKHYAPYWSEPQIRQIYESVKSKIPAYNFWDFFVTFQMRASDQWLLFHEWWPDITPETFAQKITEDSVNWLNDPDWPTQSKVWDYLH